MTKRHGMRSRASGAASLNASFRGFRHRRREISELGHLSNFQLRSNLPTSAKAAEFSAYVSESSSFCLCLCLHQDRRKSWSFRLRSNNLCAMQARITPERVIVFSTFCRQSHPMPTVLDGDHAAVSDRSFPKIARNDSCNSSFENMGRQDLLPLLVQRIEQLPPRAKKILAMYYYENLQLTEIATCFRLSECQIDNILTETVDLLNNYVGTKIIHRIEVD